jgi:hypothetical protein
MSTLLLARDGFSQNPWHNDLVSKRQLNVWISTDFSDAVQARTPRVGPKKKWQLYAAAVLAFLQLPDTEQDQLLAAVRAADFPGGSYKPLIDGARDRGRRPRVVHTDVLTPPAASNGKGVAESPKPPDPKPAAGRRAGPRR